MSSQYKRIKTIVKKLKVFLINNLMSLIPRNKNIWAFNCMVNDKAGVCGFTHNTKYLFLYLSAHPEYNVTPVWITPDKEIVEVLRENGYRAYYKKSIKGYFYCLFAKYYLLNLEVYTGEIAGRLIYGATKINLWHGIPLKYIGNDNNTDYKKNPGWFRFIYEKLVLKNDYMIVNGEYEEKIYYNAFFMKKGKVKMLGSPRIDTIYKKLPGEELFMEKDIDYIKLLKQKGKKIIIYVPTYRDTGKNVSGFVENPCLKNILSDNNAVLLCKLHPVDNNNLKIDTSEEFYKIGNRSDVNAILKYCDFLITDYSSVAFDFLLLDKPIVYYPLDLEEYQRTCHGFYTDYKEYVAGPVAYREDELISELNEALNGVDEYREHRKILRDKMFKYQDGENCKRVTDWIRSLK